jgi:hypothetical protein
MADRCSFCGSTAGPFSKVGGLFTVMMCADCQAVRGHGSGPYPVMTRAEMRAGLDLLPTWALEQKAALTVRSSSSCASDWLPTSRWRACTRSRGWPGWSAKPRLWRTWSPSARQRTAEVVVATQRPLPCEDKHGPHVTSSDASIVLPTLAFSVVVCRLASCACRGFAACSPPAGSAALLSVTMPRRSGGSLLTVGTNSRSCP